MHLGFKKEWGIALYKGIGKGWFTYSSMHKWRLYKVLAFYWPSQKICSSFMTNQCYVACCLQCVGWSCITCDYHRCWCLGLNSSHHPCRFLHTTDSSDVPMAIVHIRPHISSLVIVFRKRVGAADAFYTKWSGDCWIEEGSTAYMVLADVCCCAYSCI